MAFDMLFMLVADQSRYTTSGSGPTLPPGYHDKCSDINFHFTCYTQPTLLTSSGILVSAARKTNYTIIHCSKTSRNMVSVKATFMPARSLNIEDLMMLGKYAPVSAETTSQLSLRSQDPSEDST